MIQEMQVKQNEDTCLNSENMPGNLGESDEAETHYVCRLCHFAEIDERGDTALVHLDIQAPFCSVTVMEQIHQAELSTHKKKKDLSTKSPAAAASVMDLGEGIIHDALIELGCLCKGDLAIAHYSCALRWFVSRGTLICEICGSEAANIRLSDHRKIVDVLKDFEALRAEVTQDEEAVMSASARSSSVLTDFGDSEAIRRQRLAEVVLWFDPHNYDPEAIGLANRPRPVLPNYIRVPRSGSPTAKWAIEGTGLLVAAALLTVTLASLIAPQIGKKADKKGLHILIGGLCALMIVVFLRFGILPRIKYGPARYWAVLLLFWFLVFGVWVSSTRGTQSR